MKFTVEHVAIGAVNTIKLKDWYHKTLQTRQLLEFQNDGRMPTFLMEAGGIWLEIFPADKDGSARGERQTSGFRHLALQVESLEMAKYELTKRGVVFPEGERPAAGGGKVLFFTDAEGNWLHLVERSNTGLDRRKA